MNKHNIKELAEKLKDVMILKKENEITISNENELTGVENIYQDIRNKIITAREKMFKHIDNTMTEVYWYVGKMEKG